MSTLDRPSARLLALAVALASTLQSASAQHWINAGVRVSWDLKTGAFRPGFEASFTMFSSARSVHGPVVGVDFDSASTRLHLGYEVAGFYFLGLEAGPTIVFPRDADPQLGWHFVPFFGLFGYVFHQFTKTPDGSTKELGLMAKLSYPSNGRWPTFN